MKTLPLASAVLLMALSCSQGQTVYEFDVTSTAPSYRNWTAPATWVGAPSSYPSASDKILYKAHDAARTLVADESQFSVAEFEFSGTVPGTAASQRLFAAENVQSTVTIGTFKHLATGSSFHFANSTSDDAKLSVVIDTLETAANTTLEIGHNGLGSLENLEVTTSNLAGYLYFSGIKERAEGENRIKLGALNLTGSIMLGYRHNTGGVVEVSSLNGSGNIYLSGTDSHLGSKGTVEIHSTAATTSTFSGVLKTSNRSNPQPITETFELSLHKKGTGTQILSRSTGHDYRGGTILEEGVLAVTNTSGSGLGWGEVRVEEGGTLAGSGRLQQEKAVRIEAGGRIAPSAHLSTGVATLTFDGSSLLEGEALLSVQEGGAFSFRFGENDTSDQINFTDYRADSFTLSSTGVYLHGEGVQEGTFSLFTFNAIGSAELESLTEALMAGDGFSGYKTSFSFSSAENTIFLQVDAIPEPGTVALGIIGLAGLWVYRRLSL